MSIRLGCLEFPGNSGVPSGLGSGRIVTDGDALLREILAAPGDDLLRLVYADWLDEVGRSERAALIRVQVGLSRTPSAELRVAERRLLAPGWDSPHRRRPEWALPASVRDRWHRGVGGWEWHRGFVEAWHCRLSLWEAHAAALTANSPVRRVVLTDREPIPSPPDLPSPGWLRDDAVWTATPAASSLLPPHLFDLLEPDPLDFAMHDHARAYRSRAAALAALSEACLRLAAGVLSGG